MRIDSHTHVFLEDSPAYPWDPQARIRPNYSAPIADLLHEMDAAQIDNAVIVQHSCYGYDNRYILDCVRQYPERLRAIVKVDPLAETSPAQLAELAQHQGVRGLRLQPAAQPDSTWLADERTYPLWEICAERGLVIGILLEPQQLPLARRMITRFPAVKVIIDHMARLTTKSDKLPLQSLLDLSTFENVFVKVSGFYALSAQPYPYEDFFPIVRALYGAYGASRLMWATDFPLVVHAGETYVKAAEIVNHQLPNLSTNEQEWIMGKTAAALFGWTND